MNADCHFESYILRKVLTFIFILINCLLFIKIVAAYVTIKPLRKIQKATRFTKINLCNLSTANLSSHYLFKSKLHARASYKAIADVWFRFRGVMQTQIYDAQAVHVYFSEPSGIETKLLVLTYQIFCLSNIQHITVCFC